MFKSIVVTGHANEIESALNERLQKLNNLIPTGWALPQRITITSTSQTTYQRVEGGQKIDAIAVTIIYWDGTSR